MSHHHCGTDNADTANFCSGCGEKLPPASAVPNVMPSTSVSNKKTKALILVAVLSLAALAGTAWWKISNKQESSEGAVASESARSEQAQTQHGAKVKRKTGQDAQRAEASTARKRDTDAQTQASESQHRSAQADGSSVQQTCAGSSNATTRSFCETKECAKPSQYNTPYCVAFRKRYEQNTNNVQF